MSYTRDGRHHVLTFESVTEVANVLDNLMATDKDTASYFEREMSGYLNEWFGADSVQDAVTSMLVGLPDEGIRAAEDASDFVARVQDESPAFATVWDVSGHTVDVGAFLSGEPECMLTDVMAPTTQTVVPIVVQAGLAASIEADSVTAYGRQIMRLLLSVDAMGMQSEVWADLTCTGKSDSDVLTIRVRIKAAGEYLDPGVIAYAVTRAGFCRGIMFPLFHTLPEHVGHKFGTFGWYGVHGSGAKARPNQYPDGAFILPRLVEDDDAKRDIVTPVLDKLTGR
ncbi:hypothetical protein SEA_SEPHIROTH_134 [Gordonia Phage Sephiroth]|uniref:DUF7192 domain-containing protein n=1 Tax=Gordonia Phage Sephiroth TaxID=2767553 RepID=A0A7G9UZL3_9CAUD|nr:hypothetical protein L3Y23_gp097 [Gordonia Phage Sephiroth]QNN99468.1 hypothetical protein SEA_SEPHIROTH_134 [Gordonia Phage Sephiroth]